MQNRFWYLKSYELFARLSPEQIGRLESCSRSRRFERGSLIYLPTDQSESVLLLISGRVKLYHITSEGKQALLAFIEPGELFGELALLGPGVREEFAEAMEHSNVVLIPRDEIQQLMHEHADVSVGITKLLGLRMRRIERRLKSLLFRSNRDRLVHLLLELVEKYGRRTPEGVRLDIKLSHQDLASVIGSTRETVTVTLGELQAEGKLLVKRRQIILRNIGQLAETIDQAAPPVREDARPDSPLCPTGPDVPR